MASDILKKKSTGNVVLEGLQKLGKSLMLPIAVLPVAGLMNRLGAEDLLNLPFIQDAGAALFTYLPLLFAIGIAVGLAKEGHGAAALAGAVSYMVLGAVSQDINYAIQLGTLFAPEGGYSALVDSGALTQIDMQVFQGIIAGIIAGLCYNRFKDTKLPDWLQFFGGKRFVPIVTGGCSIAIGSILGVIWPYCQMALDTAAHWMTNASMIGEFVYGLLNRLLIPFGLHHIINTYVWFNYGTFTDATGQTVTGEITRFMQGDPTAGNYLAGFFPIMMFAMPAIALAMYVCAKKKNRPIVGGMLFSVGFTAFLTGITEPIEFMFMFLAPVLYVIHAVLTGLSMVVTSMLGVLDGFSFSAGLFDYVLNWGLATKPWMIIPIGLVTAAVYFFLFVFVIKKFNIKTPGREDDEDYEIEGTKEKEDNSLENLATSYIDALGGQNNIKELESCITRLRLVLKNNKQIDEKQLKKIGAAGVMKAGENVTQVVVGTKAELIADAMKRKLAEQPKNKNTNTQLEQLAIDYLKALGGKENIEELESCITRLRLVLKDNTKIDEKKLKSLGAAGVMKVGENVTQVVVGTRAELIADAIKRQM